MVIDTLTSAVHMDTIVFSIEGMENSEEAIDSITDLIMEL